MTTSISMSAHRSLPIKFFEYVAAGLPMVVSGIPELRRMVEEYQIGLVCDPDDPQDIADKINQMLKPETLARYRENVQKARAELNWEHEEKKLIDIYRNILED